MPEQHSRGKIRVCPCKAGATVVFSVAMMVSRESSVEKVWEKVRARPTAMQS